MEQVTKYPTREEVIDVATKYAERHAPQFTLSSIHLQGDSLRSFSVSYTRRGTDQVLRVSMKVIPNFTYADGWHHEDDRLTYVGPSPDNEPNLYVYPMYLQRLMELYPHHAIVSLDNEDEPAVFGYGVIEDNRVIAFAQHDSNDPETRAATHNDYLPHGQVVTDPDIMEAINDNEADRIAREWIDDVKEWWA